MYVCAKDCAPALTNLDLFPPAFFMTPLWDDDEFLMLAFSSFRYGANASHRFSKFILTNAKQINERMPGVLREIVRSLAEDECPTVIERVNELLERIRRCKGIGIIVPDEVFLKETDFCLPGQAHHA